MTISTKGRYALRIMMDLGGHIGETVKLKDIAARQEISEKYMEQIIAVLNKSGYVRSTRGAQGGYQLVKKPQEYTVGMILRLTEGDMAPVACLEGDKNDCPRASSCTSIRLWMMLDDAIKSVIDHVTLQDMLEWSMEAGNDYVI